MSFLTIFSAPKPFTDSHINTIQRNAIQSWLNLGDEVQVFLVGEEDGMAEVAAELGVAHLPDVTRNEWGTPLVSSIFSLTWQTSQSPILAYVNADILLMYDFVEVARLVATQAEEFLVVGQRWDYDLREALDFSPNWEQQLRDKVHNQGQLHSPAGSDFFIFPRSIFNEIPDFAIGRAGWDNWMIYHAIKNGWQVLDATADLMVVHQNHDYSHLPEGKAHYDLEETSINAALGGGMSNMYMLLDANYQLVGGEIRRPHLTLPRVLRLAERVVAPRDDESRGIRWKLARHLRRWRRRVV